MSQIDMDNNLEQEAVIANLSLKDLNGISFMEMLDILRPFVLIQVPEDAESVNARRRYDFLLGRLANSVAYVRYLFAYASYMRDRWKKAGDPRADDMLKKKEALYEIKEGIERKYEAVSRKITLALEDEDQSVVDRANYDGRRAARDSRSTQSAKPSHVSTTPQKSGPAGGWGSI
jgi:hypothetical protein